MSNKMDLMASLMGGSVNVSGSSDAVVATEGAGAVKSTTHDLFGDDVDETPPLAADSISSSSTFLASATTAGLFSTNTKNGTIFGDSDDNILRPHSTDAVGCRVQSPTVNPPPLPTTPPPPLPPPPPPSMEPTKSSILEESGLLGFSTISSSPGVTSVARPGSSADSGGGGLFDDVDEQQGNEEKKRQEAEAEVLMLRESEEEHERIRKHQVETAAEFEQQLQQEREELERRRVEHEQQYQQQLQDQMQSIYLGGSAGGGYGSNDYGGNSTSRSPVSLLAPSQYHQQLQHQQQTQQPVIDEPPVTRVSAVFYRDHEQNSDQQSNPRFYQPEQSGNYAPGLQNNGRNHHHPINNPKHPPPRIAQPIFGKVIVSEPILIQSQSIFGISQPPHWTYQIATEILPQQQSNNPTNFHHGGGGGGVWLVRRRFRHVVALEDRLRDDCPGAILPPRPEKHAIRALEEASTSQSVDFAMQRASELQIYLNELVNHPICYKSPVLRLFLALQDDLGTAWTECSGNALMRLASASVGAAIKVSENTAATTKLPWQTEGGLDDFGGGGEDNAELLSLQSAESIRMGLVQQAVPKLEGAVTLLREHAEQAGATGMELSRLVKELHFSDIELSQPVEIVAAGMLRSGRRSKRLAIELAAAIQSYQHHYKLCRYEKHAFQDRKNALYRRAKERMKADQRAAQLVMHQRAMYGGGSIQPGPYQQQQQQQYSYGGQDRMAQEAASANLFATDAWNDAEEIGQRLTQEVYRCAWNRRNEWAISLKIVASSMKEAFAERVAIWETVQGNFLQTFPEYKQEFSDNPAAANVITSNEAR